MSEKVSTALIKMLNEMANIETTNSKVQGAIFTKKCDKLIKEKVSCLYNLLQFEANTYNQKSKNVDYIEKIINKYNEKLNVVYDEFYLQYVNIQNELGEARLNQKAAIINYQKIINESENNSRKYDDLKNRIKSKSDLYEKIVEKCQNQIEICISNFEKQIDLSFSITSNLPVINEKNIFQTIKNKIINLFEGNKRYLKSLSKYESNIDNIDVNKIIQDVREQTVEFVTDILEIKDVNLDEAV